MEKADMIKANISLARLTKAIYRSTNSILQLVVDSKKRCKNGKKLNEGCRYLVERQQILYDGLDDLKEGIDAFVEWMEEQIRK